MSETNDPSRQTPSGAGSGSGAEPGYGVGENYGGAPSPYGAAAPDPYAGAGAGGAGATPSAGSADPFGGGPAPWDQPTAGGAGGANPSPYGIDPAHTHGSPYLQSGGYAPPSARGTGRTGCLVAAVIVGAVMVLIVGLIVAFIVAVGRTSGSEPTPDPPATTDHLTETWLATPQDLSPGVGADTQLGIGVDGAFTGPSFIGGESAWIVTLDDAGSAPFAVVGLDPATGAPLWEHDLPGVLCGDAELDGVIMCVSRDGGAWQGHVIDAATGEIRLSWATGLTSAATVHHTAAGLIVVGDNEPQAPHARISLLTREGATAWSVDLADVPGGESLFSDFLASDLGNSDPDDVEATLERPRWRQLDGGLIMLWSTPGAAIIDPATGTVFAHECRRATVAGSAYYCVTDAGITRHDLDGKVVWTLPGLTLTHPSDISPGRPVAYDESNYAIVGVDWDTGTVTHTVATLAPSSGGFVPGVSPLSSSGSPEYLVVAGGASMIALAPDADTLAWTWEPEDGGYIGDVYVVGDLLVLDGFEQVGFDPVTGDELWTARVDTGIYRQVVDDRVATIGFEGIALLELP
ncbi:PQQ-binding-like beta-propeller repeat protein [Occultella aeris]|uniref:Pyrrolo-quinoline quinone repeat domain-containing protein n=1 Tax=Occultella aeris TaxID=2761496 RepID=A0A7M4DMU6_9MICO|nr:PQQ-binding-like beta-propeller repeat protein [Occultella aeris]VZO38741.1 hypothetical protein HALOF300_03473 [Occultella aeris]